MQVTLSIATLIGIRLSKHLTGSYELFRAYMQKGIQNDFYLNERYQNGLIRKSISKNDLLEQLHIVISSLISVPASTHSNNDWVRSRVQTLKRSILEDASDESFLAWVINFKKIIDRY